MPKRHANITSGSYQITVKDVYDKLGQVADTLSAMSAHMVAIDTRNAAADTVHADFESRIRRVEAWRYALPITGIVSIGSIVAAIISLLHH